MKLTHRRKVALIVGIAALAMAITFVFPPLAQDLHYHDFADGREILGIPNFWNVVSNFPFVFVGLLGLHEMAGAPLKGALSELRLSYLYVFLGLLLVGIGSSYYHAHPSNATLLWDRMPLTIAFMGFVSALVGEHVSIPVGRRLLWPLLAVGLASVIYWYATETIGRGDLRLYFLVQFLPMGLIPLILLLFGSRLSKSGYIWAVLGAYTVAKILELEDRAVFDMLGGISGHSLKHLAAALGGYIIVAALRNRRPIEPALVAGRA